ncbi:MAG: choice-of-anchor D domain-containing protein [bacterium]
MNTNRSWIVWAILLPLMLFAAGRTSAQAEDALGIYFDPDGLANQIFVPTGGMVQAYLCLLDASNQSGIAGWECAISHTPGLEVLAWDIQGGHLNVSTPPEFAVGLFDPLDWQPSIVLMEMTVRVIGPSDHEFFLHPSSTPSVPDHMVYAASDDLNELIPLNWPTGGEEFPVAIIESDPMPPECTITPPALDFGEVMVGDWAEADFTIANIGGESLTGEVPSACGDFQVIAGVGPFALSYGQTHDVTVKFMPPAEGLYMCTLYLGATICDSVPCSGNGTIPPPPICDVAPPTLDFGEVQIGQQAELDFVISNPGEAVFSGEVPADCPPGFEVTEGAGEFFLRPGEEWPVTVRFTPQDAGEHTCTLDLGQVVCAQVLCLGSAVLPPPLCQIDPTELDFGDVIIGNEAFQTFTICNVGGASLDGSVPADCSPNFQVTEGAGSFVLASGETRSVTVRFTPATVGAWNCLLEIEGICDDVPLVGEGRDPQPGCHLSRTNLDFGDVVIGSWAYRDVTITSVGIDPLIGEVTETCGSYEIVQGAGPFSLAPDERLQVIVGFSPPAEAMYDCVVSLGTPTCADVVCSGRGAAASSDQDVLGIYFNGGASVDSLEVMAFTPFTAYLCVTNLTELSGIAGWECRVDWTESLDALLWLPRGEGVNMLPPPEFSLVLDTPLPWQSAVVLMEILAVGTDVGICDFFLHPVSVPVFPGIMYYRAGDDPERMIPLHWSSGGEDIPVATVIVDEPVGVAAEPPQARQDADEVLLAWSCEAGDGDRFQVYRRVGTGPPELLLSTPTTGSGGRVEYRDVVQAIPAGTVLHYCYAVVRADMEISRSPETRITLADAVPGGTVLLPNYPNPFNPRTTIRYELAEPNVVVLRVYDVTGQLIRVLRNGVQVEAGRHEVIWHGRDELGRPVASGTYFARLEAGNFVQTRRMVLVR